MMTFKELKLNIQTSENPIGRSFESIPTRHRLAVVSALGKLGFIEKYSSSITFSSISKIIFWVSYVSGIAELLNLKGYVHMGDFVSSAFVEGDFTVWSTVEEPTLIPESAKTEDYHILIAQLTDIITNSLDELDYISISANGGCLIKKLDGTFTEFGRPFVLYHALHGDCQTKSYTYSASVIQEIISAINPAD